MAETLSNNYLISQFIANSEVYRTSYLSLLEKLVSSLTTDSNVVTISTEVGQIDIPSNNFLMKRIKSLENLLTEALNGKSVVGPDGISRKFEPISNISSSISLSSSIINYSQSRKFLDLFVTLKIPLNIGKSKNANVRLYKIKSGIIPEFLNDNYSVEESLFLRDCSINNIVLDLFEFDEFSITEKPTISGSFTILKKTDFVVTLNSLYCDEPSRNLLNSRLLRIGDFLIDENSSSSYKITEINTVDNTVKLELVTGIGNLTLSSKLYAKYETTNQISISVLPNEKLVAFVRTEGSISNPKSKFINVANYNVLDSVGNAVDVNSLLELENVFNYFKGLFLERRISIFNGVIPNTPTLNVNNFKIIKTNEHRIVDIDKNKVIGFWDVPSSISNQNIVCFKVQYRYLDLTENNAISPETYSQQILLNNSVSTGSYSAWNETRTSVRNKSIINGEVVWEPANESDSNIRSFNSIDLPILNKERIQIRIKALSEVGFDNNNPLESEWSNIIQLELNEVTNLRTQYELSSVTDDLINRISRVESTISSPNNLNLSIVDSKGDIIGLEFDKQNVINLPNFQNYLTLNNLVSGNLQYLNYSIKIKNNTINAIKLKSRDFTYIGDVKSSKNSDSTFDINDREYNEFLKHDTFGFNFVKQLKSQILRLRGTSLFGDDLNSSLINAQVLVDPDYSPLSSLSTNNNGEIYSPTGKYLFNDITSLNLTNWFFIHKDSTDLSLKANKIFSQNFKNISVENSTIKNNFIKRDIYLVGPLSTGISFSVISDIDKIKTDNYGNFYLNSGEEIKIDISIISRLYDYMGNIYQDELIKILGFDLFMFDGTRKSFDLKFTQK